LTPPDLRWILAPFREDGVGVYTREDVLMATNSYHVDESRPWFTEEAGWPVEVPKNFDFPRMTLSQMLDESIRQYADNPVAYFIAGFMTYRQFGDHVDRLATAFHRMGLKKGDVVTMLLPNSFQYLVGYYACQRIGLIASGINPTYKPGEVLHQLKLTKSKALVVLDALYESTVAPILKDSSVEHLVVTNVVDLVPMSPVKKFLGKTLKKIPTGPVPPTAMRLMDLLKTPPAPPAVAIDPDEPATYIMTGGTTGVPKAAMLSHTNCVSNAIQSRLWLYKLNNNIMNIGILPLFHSFAMTCVMNLTIHVGGWMLLFPKPPPMDELCKAIQDLTPPGGATFCGAEILFKKFAEFPGLRNYDLAGKLTLCVSGAGPLHRPVQEAFESITGGRLSEGYGLTETSPVVSAHPFWGNRKIGTIGLPFPGTEWRIVDNNDHKRTLPLGEAGEIAVAGPQIMLGYLDHPQDTADTIVEMDGKRWCLTGDIGRMDPQGRISIEDRKKQMIKYKGYAVFPTEVETLLMGHESISEVAVASLPDPEATEIIKAWVVLKPEYQGKVTEEQLLAWAKENLTHYKVPRYIQFVPELPKTLVGKVLRRVLQEADPIWIAAHKK
jgi:long-chain acyl-CoA synthetase